MAKSKGPRRVQCYHCGHRFEVSGMAQSTSCAGCNKSLIVHDIHVKGRALHGPTKDTKTCGKVIVDKNARMISDTIVAHGGVDCMGTIDSKKQIITSHFHLGPKARFKGNVAALTAKVELGAQVQGEFRIPDDPQNLDELEHDGLDDTS